MLSNKNRPDNNSCRVKVMLSLAPQSHSSKNIIRIFLQSA